MPRDLIVRYEEVIRGINGYTKVGERKTRRQITNLIFWYPDNLPTDVLIT